MSVLLRHFDNFSFIDHISFACAYKNSSVTRIIYFHSPFTEKISFVSYLKTFHLFLCIKLINFSFFGHVVVSSRRLSLYSVLCLLIEFCFQEILIRFTQILKSDYAKNPFTIIETGTRKCRGNCFDLL